MTSGEVPSSGHSYFGVVNSGEQAHAIIEASKLGLLPRVTRRLTDEERIRFVRAGAVFVWEEEEAGIRRWTDHIKWSPSRVSGAFLTYTEVPAKGIETLIKQSFSSVDPTGTKMHLIAYSNKIALSDGSLPSAAHDPLIQGMLARRSTGGRDPRQQPDPLLAMGQIASPASRSDSTTPNPSKRRQYRGSHPALPPIFPVAQSPAGSADSLALAPPPPSTTLPPMLLDPRQRPQSTSHDGDSRPRSASSAYDDRPRTSSSEPRSTSSHDSLARPNFPASSFSYSAPSLVPAPSSSSSSTSSSPRPLPSFFSTLSSHSQANRAPLPTLHHPTDPTRLPPRPAFQTATPLPFDLPIPLRMASTAATGFDPHLREAALFPSLPPILSAPPRQRSPPSGHGTVHEDGLPLQADDGRARSRRGLEDERQLSLLGRRL